MAKKKQNLTPEELLEQALVPEQEWPYSVPENWVWVRLGSLVEIIGGGTPSKSNPEYWSGDISWASVKDVKGDYLFETVDKISELGLANSSANLADINDLILVTRIEPGKTIIPQIRVAVNQDLKVIKSKLPIKFLHYYFKNFINEFVKQSSGSTVLGITLDKVQSTVFPLPPLCEQQRIVERIESLFEKLDQAKKLIQDALDSFENRKAAILHKAFSGELTKKWREENGVGMESWKQFKLKDVCSIPITDGTHQTPTYCSKEDGGIPFISAKDVTTGKINWGNTKFITPELHVKLYERVAPQIDDVLLAKNGTTGIAAMVEADKVFDIYVTLALLRPNKEVISPKYLLSVINAPNAKNQFNEHLTGIGVPNLHLRDIRVVDIYVPSIDEQHEIVRLLENLIVNEEQSRDLLFETYEKIEIMKKAVLSRAFRGELGTNYPDEESSLALLSEVLNNG